MTTTDTTVTVPDLAGLRARWDAPYLGATPEEDEARGDLTRRLAAAILAARVGTTVGDLIITRAGWSVETAARADATAPAGAEAWYAALGAHEDATLTADGRGAERTAWCQCAAHGLQQEGVPVSEWVRYEGWTARGCEAHGFVHSECRRLLQAG